MKKIFTAPFIILCLFAVTRTWAQPGSLDPLFGAGGIFTSNLNTDDGGVMMTAMEVAPDDRIFMVGYRYQGGTEDIAVVCLNANGTPDPAFGNNGSVFIDASLGGEERATAVTIQPDGKIMMCGLLYDGTERSILVRLNADGTLDDTFGNSGIIPYGIGETKLWDVAVDAQNRIVVVGNAIDQGETKSHMARFLPNGTLDNTFSGDGKIFTHLVNDNMPEFLYAVAIVNGNQVVVLGVNALGNEGGLMVAKYDGTGELDPAFADQGVFLMESPNEDPLPGDIRVTTEGNVWFTGGIDGAGTVAKLTPSGTLDPLFSQDGKLAMLSMENITGIRLFSDRVVLGGVSINNPDFECRTLMLNTDGSNIQNFGNAGIAEHAPHANTLFVMSMGLAVQSTGHIIHGGAFTANGVAQTQMYAMRLLNPGFASVEENMVAGFSVYPNPTVQGFRIKTENDINIQRVSLWSMAGREVCSWNTTATQYDLPPYLPAGTYVVRVQAEEVSYLHQLLTVRR